jgi:two-component sensor histidine kinase
LLKFDGRMAHTWWRTTRRSTRDRVISVAAVQKYLHASTAGGSVALIPYLSNFCKAISCSMISDNQAISIEVRGEGGSVDRQKAESLGLIVVQLVINSLKHAFGGVTEGGIMW